MTSFRPPELPFCYYKRYVHISLVKIVTIHRFKWYNEVEKLISTHNFYLCVSLSVIRKFRFGLLFSISFTIMSHVHIAWCDLFTLITWCIALNWWFYSVRISNKFISNSHRLWNLILANVNEISSHIFWNWKCFISEDTETHRIWWFSSKYYRFFIIFAIFQPVVQKPYLFHGRMFQILSIMPLNCNMWILYDLHGNVVFILVCSWVL